MAMTAFVEPLIIFLGTLNVLIYLSWTIFGFHPFGSIASIVITLILLFVYRKSLVTRSPANVNLFTGVIISILIFGVVAGVSVVLSPFVRIVNASRFPIIGLTSVTDMFKHSYTVTTITENGVNPGHPYFPPAAFSYYYGYYLVPGLLSTFFKSYQNLILYLYILLTDAVALTILAQIICRLIKPSFLRFFAVLLVLFGLGWDIVPMWGSLSFPNLIEMWSITNHSGLRVDNLFTSLLWSPQHFFAAVLSLYLLYRLLAAKISPVLFVLLLSFVCLSSAFVALSLAFCLLLVFVFRPHLRLLILKAGVFVLIVLAPYLASIVSRGQGLFEIYKFHPFSFSSSPLINTFLTMLSEYGIIIVTLPLLYHRAKLHLGKSALAIYLAIYVPIIITWFVRSLGYNDFALRGVILSQLFSIVLIIWLASREVGRIKGLVIAIILVNLAVSFPGFVYEYLSRWKTRSLLDPYESELILELRRHPFDTSIAAIGKGEWIYKIPPLAFTSVVTSDLYDSGVYLKDSPLHRFGDYERMEKDIFFRQNEGLSVSRLVDSRNQFIRHLPSFLSGWNFDWLLFDRRIGVKGGRNPWVKLFENLGVAYRDVTPTFRAYEKKDMLRTLAPAQVSIVSTPQKVVAVDNKVIIGQGLWYIAGCNSSAVSKNLRFEPEDQYVVYEAYLPPSSCAGNVFYAPRSGEYKLIGDPGNIYLLPLR